MILKQKNKIKKMKCGNDSCKKIINNQSEIINFVHKIV